MVENVRVGENGSGTDVGLHKHTLDTAGANHGSDLTAISKMIDIACAPRRAPTRRKGTNN